jgi:hypothetical protein
MSGSSSKSGISPSCRAAGTPQLASAVQRLTLAAWQIDAAGDLGNKERLLELARDFTQAIADIEGLYAPAR